MRAGRRRTLVVGLAAALVVAGAGPAAADAAATTGHGEALVVDLSADGSAAVTLVTTYDLDSDDERAAFESLRNDSAAQANLTERYVDRLSAVAAAAENATGREMRVADGAVELTTRDGGSVGVVRLSATWTGLAAVDGDTVSLGEPFASGFESDRRLVVTLPDGYEVADATPTPTERADGRLVWAPGTDLSGFGLVAVPAGTTPAGEDATDGGGDAPTDVGSPGFGVGAALVALAAGLAAARRR